MKLNDFKSFIAAHKRIVSIKKDSDPITEQTIVRETTADTPVRRRRHLPYHAVLRPRLSQATHFLQTHIPSTRTHPSTH